MTGTGFLVIGACLEAVRNLATGTSSDAPCGATLPELPASSFPCYYDQQATLAGWAVMVVLVALTAWGWWGLAGWVLRPLAAAADTVRRLGPQNLGQRVRLEGGHDRFKELADALDDALDRLAAGLREPAPVRGQRLPRAAHPAGRAAAAHRGRA